MKKLKQPILGQEAVVPTYGLGRITGLDYAVNNEGVWIRPYVLEYPMKFDRESIKLVKIEYDN